MTARQIGRQSVALRCCCCRCWRTHKVSKRCKWCRATRRRRRRRHRRCCERSSSGQNAKNLKHLLLLGFICPTYPSMFWLTRRPSALATLFANSQSRANDRFAWRAAVALRGSACEWPLRSRATEFAVARESRSASIVDECCRCRLPIDDEWRGYCATREEEEKKKHIVINKTISIIIINFGRKKNNSNNKNQKQKKQNKKKRNKQKRNKPNQTKPKKHTHRFIAWFVEIWLRHQYQRLYRHKELQYSRSFFVPHLFCTRDPTCVKIE